MKHLLFVLAFLSFVPIASASSSEAVESLTEQGIISGYPDGAFRLETSINRAEFLKIVVLAGQGQTEGADCFTDVTNQWFAPYVCWAKTERIVGGYADGSFGPENGVTLVEALKMLAKALEVPTEEPSGKDWYSEYLEMFAEKNAIPATVDYYNELLTRGEAFDLLWRVLQDEQGEEATTLDEFKGPVCEDFEAETLEGIDVDRVRDTWFSWTNAARASADLPGYEHDEQLDRTAYLWSVYGRERGTMTHTRPGTSAYYDYFAIQNWFKNLGLTFNSVGGYTFTENIGRGPYSCSAADCTDELIAAIKYTFDYFMSEAGSSYRPHYNSIMNSQFEKVGFGLVVDEGSYYMTIHYATELTSTLAPFCD